MSAERVRAAVILAAGKGERLWPLTATRPKPLVPIANEPLLARLMRQLGSAGIERATVVVADDKDAVAQSASKAATPLGLRVELAVQREQRGTGHALQQVELPDEPIVVTYGDLFFADADVRAFVAAGAEPRIAGKEMRDVSLYGALAVQGDRLVAIHEKSATPPSNVANAGLYTFPRGFADDLASIRPSPRNELELTDAVTASAQRGVRYAVHRLTVWSDVGWPWDLLAANEAALATLEPAILGTVEEGAVLKGAVRVEHGALVKSGAYLEGPILVGPDAVVGPNCYLRGSTTLGRAAKVGHACEVKNSVLFEDAKVPHLSYVGDSVLGAHVNLGAGTVVANLRHDDRTVRVHTKRGLVDSGRRKLGVVLGDGVKTGINSTLNCGVMLGPGEAVGPGETVARTRSFT